MSGLTVLLADDHAFLREGLRELIENQPGLRVVGEAETGKEAVTLARRHKPNIVIMDISMAALNGIDATKQLKELDRGISVIILSMHSEKNIIRDAFQAGAAGYILKKSAFSEISDAIQTVGAGQAYISPQIATMVISDLVAATPVGDSGSVKLTSRERQVLQLIAEGSRSKEIADQLGVGVRTIDKVRIAIISGAGPVSVF